MLLFILSIETQLKKYGLTGIGGIPYMTNFNFTLNGKVGMTIGKKVAAKIRHSNPDGTGCLGVQSMAFHHRDNHIEIACNVDLVEYNPSNRTHLEELSIASIKLLNSTA